MRRESSHPPSTAFDPQPTLQREGMGAAASSKVDVADFDENELDEEKRKRVSVLCLAVLFSLVLGLLGQQKKGRNGVRPKREGARIQARMAMASANF